MTKILKKRSIKKCEVKQKHEVLSKVLAPALRDSLLTIVGKKTISVCEPFEIFCIYSEVWPKMWSEFHLSPKKDNPVKMKFHFLFINLIIPHQMLEKVGESLGFSFYLKGQMESGVSINVMIVRCEFNCPCPVERILNWSFITKVWSLPHRFVDICYVSIKKLLIFLAWKRSKTFSKDCQADQAIKNVLMTLYVTLLPCIYVLSFIFNI